MVVDDATTLTVLAALAVLQLTHPDVFEALTRATALEPLTHLAQVVGDMTRTPISIGAAIRERHHDVVFADTIAKVQQALRTDANSLP
ncbi:hypothetical protein D9M72_611470 [compost metagenome]